jgi:hypothetical protein
MSCSWTVVRERGSRVGDRKSRERANRVRENLLVTRLRERAKRVRD